MFAKSVTFALLASLLGTSAAPTVRRDGVQVINSCYNNGQVALTYDDGPYQYEDDIANQFGDQKATFFLNGNNYVCIYDQVDQVRALHAAGHTLGSHTWSHKDMTKISTDEMHQELEKVENAFINILGLKPLYFRPPYGAYNDQVLDVLAQRGYKKVFLWSDDTGDANGESVDYSKNVIDGVANSYPSPKMVLEHSVIDTTASQVVPYAINRLNSAGYQLVAVDTCLGDDGEWPYEYVREPGSPDGSWHC
ncbi:hypothetical protein IAU60_003707 [Kwoniella sp. DSM 27419]